MSTPDRAGRDDLHAPFRPVRSRRVAVVVAVTQAVLFAALALLMPGSGPTAWQWYDRVGLLLFAALVAALLRRYARIEALADDAGLHVRNLVNSRDLEWPEVVAVRFGDGDPWVTLDVADGDTLAVMAIQRADGPQRSQAEARRLATLVALHSRTPRDG